MTLILPHIERLTPYALGDLPPEGSAAIKLNQNESPYPPSPLVLEALRTLGEEELRRYPDARCMQLRAALSQLHGVKDEQIFCGNGSSEIISLIVKGFIGPNRRLALPDPSFSLYHTVAASYQASSIAVPTRNDYTVDPGLLMDSGADAIVLVNPNAPTGHLLPLEEVERLVNRFPGLVVIDEAYIDFADPNATAIPLVDRYPNVIVVRTFSKAYALCGARVGYCIAAEPLIAALEKSKDIYNINAISRKLALAALEDREYTMRTVAAVKATRDGFIAELRSLGFDVIPSQTNFVLCTPPAGDGQPDARAWYQSLLERNIYVRHFEHPRLADKLRISIGTDEEMAAVTAVLRALLA